MSVFPSNIIVLRNYRLIFELCHYFYPISLNFGRSLCENKPKRFPVAYMLLFVMVLCSTHGLFFYTTRFRIFFIFELNFIPHELIFFACKIIILLTSPNEGKNSRKNA